MKYQLIHTESGQKVREMPTMEKPNNSSFWKSSVAKIVDNALYNDHIRSLKEYPVTGPPFPYDHLAVLPEGVVQLEHQAYVGTQNGIDHWQDIIPENQTKQPRRIAAKYLPPQEKDVFKDESKIHLAKLAADYSVKHSSLEAGAHFVEGYRARQNESPSVKVEGEESQEEVKELEKWNALIDLHIGQMWGGLEMASIKYFIETGTINGSFKLRLIALLVSATRI